MKTMTIKLPEYAIRYLLKMCEDERARLANREFSLQSEAAVNSLRAIEDALPLGISK
jgi:hypothetical protein